MGRRSKGPWIRKGQGFWVQRHGQKIFLSHDEHEAKRLWHLVQAGQPLDDAPDGSTLFWEAVDAYCTEIDRTRSKGHLRGTRWRLDQLCEHWAKRAVVTLKLRDVEKVMESHAWGPTTQANVLTSLRGLLRWASRPGGLIPANPLPILTLPRPVKRIHTLSKVQVAAWLKAAAMPLRTMLKALADTGARPSELRRANASDCDADGAAIRLPTGKQGRRIIYFPKASRAAIKKLRKTHEGGALFRQPNGAAWSEFWFNTLAREARKKAKLPDWATSYVLRHTWISERLREGVPIATVARMAGTSVMLCDKTYGHLADQDLRKVADGMG